MATPLRWLPALLLLSSLSANPQARFDLTGPKIDIHVTRAGVSLPIASVPNLQPGDQIWLHPELPPTQSVRYLLIAAFLRGTTNPPPDAWFFRIETWQKKVAQEGVSITVPREAQQAVLFLAPETGGDFTTLRSAVKGRPGIFVRASQDLTEAGFEQARTDKYLAAMKLIPPGDNAALLEHSNLLARTLNLKPNPECTKRPLDQQYTCLTQTGTQTLLDDGHSQSVVAALSTGPGSDFINQASYTQLAGAGTYSAYVGAIVDFVRIVNSIHTAKYQYIPAIASPENDALNLRLNTPPSFNNPKSVIVISLPAVAPALPPPLRPVDPTHIACLLNPKMVLPIEGAPLVFSTAFAHNLVLHLNTPAAPILSSDLPLKPDAFQGGLVLTPPTERHELPLTPTPTPTPAEPPTRAPTATAPTTPGQPITGTIQGMWGFDSFHGPTVALQQLPGEGWHILPTATPSQPQDQTQPTLIVGQPNHLQLLASGTACIQSISLQPPGAAPASKLDWKLAAAEPPPAVPIPAVPIPIVPPVDLTLNLTHAAAPGSIHLAIQQFGRAQPDQLNTRTFAEPARIEALLLHAGDTSATLTGSSLNQVKSLTLNNLTYTCPPQVAAMIDSPCNGASATLTLPPDARPPAFKPNDKLTAEVHLEDGRTLPIATSVLPPRPAVAFLSSRLLQPTPSPIQIATSADLPLGAQLLFFLKSQTPYPRAQQIEIASLDNSLHTSLSIAAGSLVLENAHTVLATFDPLKTFGPSTFGPFHLRAVDPAGTPGEWLPLTTIVRLPTLTGLHCPALPTLPCQLEGSALYLIDTVSLDPAFTSPTPVAEGFVDPSLAIPRPPLTPASLNTTPTATFYLRLRDDPTTPHQVTLPTQVDPPPAPHPHSPNPPL